MELVEIGISSFSADIEQEDYQNLPKLAANLLLWVERYSYLSAISHKNDLSSTFPSVLRSKILSVARSHGEM